MTEPQNKLKRVLELAARQIALQLFPIFPTGEMGSRVERRNEIRDQIWEVLVKRLGPLLEAGRDMRDCNYINPRNSQNWDAALEQALKE